MTSGKQLILSLRSEHPMGTSQAWKLLRECRRAAVRRSPTHTHVGWRLDPKTATRIRISEIWSRHREFTARQVIRRLGAEHSVTVQWVQKILRECSRAYTRRSPARRLIGRRPRSPARTAGTRESAGGWIGPTHLRRAARSCRTRPQCPLPEALHRSDRPPRHPVRRSLGIRHSMAESKRTIP